MDVDDRPQCGTTGLHIVIFTVGPIACLLQAPWNKSFCFQKSKSGTVIVLNIPMHAGTVLPPPPPSTSPSRGWREPAEQDATRHGLLVQRQAETNNAAPCFGRHYPFRSVRLFVLSVGVRNECGHTNVPISLVLTNSQTRMPASPLVGK